jgi:integrase
MPRPSKLWKRAGREGWWATISGRKTCLGDDFEAATKEMHRLKSAARPVERSRMSVASLVDLWLDAMRGDVRETTWANYLWYAQRWCNHSGHRVASQVKPLDVTAWLKSEQTWNSSTRRAGAEISRQWSRWCKSEGYIDSDVLEGIRYPKAQKRPPAKPGDIERFLAGISDVCFLDLVLVLLDTGARPGEVRSLSASQIDWETKTARVIGKTGERTISLTDRALATFVRLTDVHPIGPILRNSFGGPWKPSAVIGRFRRINRRAGTHVFPYHFRHAFGPRARKAGVDSIIIARQLGHANLNMQATRYAHVETEETRQAVELAAKSIPLDGAQ